MSAASAQGGQGPAAGRAAANLSANGRKSNQNIQVYLRVRPTNDRERLIRSMEMVEVPSPREVIVKQTYESKMTKKFTFDRAFGPESKQSEVYQSVVAPLIEEVLAGYNCTVFAYGQTGTGKTHTMVGDEIPTMVSSWEDDSQLGIIPRSLSHLFQELRLMGVEFSMRVSYLELYNEELCDLLSASETTQIRIFDDANKKGSIIVQGLEEIPVHTTGDVYKLLSKGQEKRRMASTLMNAQSSRSHTIFSITVHIRENGLDGEELLKIGKLNLVDLAGSENLSKAGNEKGIRTRETVNINQSLLTLGRVITALVERTPHIPYRESKLTRLLQESLGGRTKTSIIATVSPGHKDIEETLSTLEYAYRAKNIQNRPEVNQKLTKKTVLKEYTEEIDRLKRDLMASRDKNGIYLAEETYQEMTFRLDSQNKDLNEKESLIKAQREELASKQRIFTEISLNLVEKATQLDATQGRLALTAEELDQTRNVLRTAKRRYQEKKLLLETHVQTEELLHGQARALIGVVDAASTDTQRLHATIDRRRSVDAQIRSATELHVRGTDEDLRRFDAMVAETVAKCKQQAGVQLNELGTQATEAEQFAATALLQMKHREEGARGAADRSKQCLLENAEALRELEREQREVFEQSGREGHGEWADFVRLAGENLGELERAVEEQRRGYAAKAEKLTAMHALAAIDASSFCSARCTAATQLMPAVRSLLAAATHTNSALRTEIAANDTRLRDMHTQMLGMSVAIQEANTAHTAQLDANAAQLAELLQLLEASDAEATAQAQQYATTAEGHAQQLGVEMGGWSAAIGDDAAAQRSLLQRQRDANAAQLSAAEQRLEATVALLAAQRSATEQRIEQLEREVAELQAADEEAARTNSAAIIAGIQTAAQRQRVSNNVCVSLNDAVQRELAEYGGQVRRHVADCRERIERFHSDELQTYKPTGETPAKRDFVYSKQLAQTSPHERIVRRFWTEKEAADVSVSEMDCSVTICEGNESAFLDGITDEKSSSILAKMGAAGVMAPPVGPAPLQTVTEMQANIVGRDEMGVQRLKPPAQRAARSASRSPTRSAPMVRSPSMGRGGGGGRMNRSAEACNNKENVR